MTNGDIQRLRALCEEAARLHKENARLQAIITRLHALAAERDPCSGCDGDACPTMEGTACEKTITSAELREVLR